ncbi:hypothetical protein [Arthrobacter bambusae]|uniref:Uncharacterized protein n=1 Tax=Arthrobacter bambusae TaxID=1338426 RepID=A0AAW8DF45_9MICC|nr:hypothetical protein [Arthrobacter bambusae]MDP9903288.1 hypothetical protein [Arthrobacter bambusae]MDQ0128718.1 hypothetical protein [Arthrobacter bambusae]MDQ0180059.1 hypothetical protein [Arthrobacter bambusae]
MAAMAAVMLCGGAAWADNSPGSGSGDDGSLQLNPNVITNSSVSASGTSEFPGVAELFIPVTAQRAHEKVALDAKQVDAARTLTFVPHPGAAFAYDYSTLRKGLFAGYRPSVIPAPHGDVSGNSGTFWLIGIGAAAVPLAAVGVWFGRRRAARLWSRHGVHAY